jgi:hypothetical protein
MKIIHSLSVQEPWAFLLTSGIKLQEIRSVPFPKNIELPTWVAIHAPLSHQLGDPELLWDICDLDASRNETFAGELTTMLDDPKWMESGNRVFGESEIVGAVRFFGSFPGSVMDTDETISLVFDLLTNRHDRCRRMFHPLAFHSSEPGCHNWMVDDCVRFHRPIVCLGHLGVRKMPDLLAKLVNKEFRKCRPDGVDGADDSLEFSEPLGKQIVFQLPKKAGVLKV